MRRIYRINLLLLLSLVTAHLQAAQECDSSVPVTTPTANFTDNGDGTVSDEVTGLMWKKCVEGLSGNDCTTGSASEFNWQMALQQAATVNATPGQTYNDWRLPNIKELASIVELQCQSPAANLVLFPATPVKAIYDPAVPDIPTAYNAFFWSATPSSVNVGAAPTTGREMAWGVDFLAGQTLRANKSSDIGFVRLVRD